MATSALSSWLAVEVTAASIQAICCNMFLGLFLDLHQDCFSSLSNNFVSDLISVNESPFS